MIDPEEREEEPEVVDEAPTDRLATLGEILETHHRRFVRKIREQREREEGA